MDLRRIFVEVILSLSTINYFSRRINTLKIRLKILGIQIHLNV